MRSRSWMAALTLVACSLGIAGAADAPARKTVVLQMQISGLTNNTVIDIRPAHPGCSFKPARKRVVNVRTSKTIVIEHPVEVTSTAADRDCTFAITISEPGCDPKTVRRGVQLAAADAEKGDGPQTFKIFLTAPSVIAKTEDSGRTVR